MVPSTGIWVIFDDVELPEETLLILAIAYLIRNIVVRTFYWFGWHVLEVKYVQIQQQNTTSAANLPKNINNYKID